ncbi:protoporphyrinogen/coproporphyrinogen oxidase [Gordonia polyisoprenivorans]|uniref:protoporphyrinogen/coproporphyrinogen oxidase n=1 Tax=Gordonia polyisoprenivorans TaxID=84595 RepID=UPI001AD68E81|nr:NAD(P)/FAD-dependent oxidoreductase [Gordonia polyisoprenivorans]QTI68967.1 FAD-dependent oxidoreductase [Gordonia polyisoprenivorans]
MFVVIGGGAAGCAAAFVLNRAGHRVTLLEASGDLGGRTRTVDRDGFGVEVGAIYMLNSYERCVELLSEAGSEDLLIPWSPLAGLWDGAKLHPLRYDSIPTFFRLPILSLADKARLAVKVAQAVMSPAPAPFETDSLASFDDGENMETWSRRNLGDNIFECFVRPMIEPSFGSDCRDLSVPYLRGIMKRAHKSKFRLPREGMGSICAALTKGIDVQLGSEAIAVDKVDDAVTVTTASGETLRAEGVVVATDSLRAAEILEPMITPNAVRALRDAPYASMAHVNLRWAVDPWPGNDVEMLLPIGVGDRPILGTIVKTGATSPLVPSGARMLDAYLSSAATKAMTDQEMIDTTLRHVGEILGPAVPEPVAEVFTDHRALAVCPPGHYRAMQQLRNSMPGRVRIAGDYLAHLGVETAVVSGDRAAKDLLASD